MIIAIIKSNGVLRYVTLGIAREQEGGKPKVKDLLLNAQR